MLKNRANEGEWHKLPIIEWYPSKKAVKSIFMKFRLNIKLNPHYVKIQDSDYIFVWGAYLNWCADNCLKAYHEWRRANK